MTENQFYPPPPVSHSAHPVPVTVHNLHPRLSPQGTGDRGVVLTPQDFLSESKANLNKGRPKQTIHLPLYSKMVF